MNRSIIPCRNASTRGALADNWNATSDLLSGDEWLYADRNVLLPRAMKQVLGKPK
jgi:hypothetical protein